MPLAATSPKIAASSGPTTGTASPGWAICQRMTSIRQNPKNRKHRAVMPYWMPMTLWSVEKTYVLQKPASSW